MRISRLKKKHIEAIEEWLIKDLVYMCPFEKTFFPREPTCRSYLCKDLFGKSIMFPCPCDDIGYDKVVEVAKEAIKLWRKRYETH